MRAALLAHFNEEPDPDCPSTLIHQYEEEIQHGNDTSLLLIQSRVSFDEKTGCIIAHSTAVCIDSMKQERDQRMKAEHAACEAERSRAELITMGGMCRWDRVIKLREEDVIARSITRAPAGTPRRTSYFRNALNTEAILGISKEDLEDRGDFEAGPSPGAKLIEAKMPWDPTLLSKWMKCMRAALLAHFNEEPDPDCPSTLVHQHEVEIQQGNDTSALLIQSRVSFDEKTGCIISHNMALCIDSLKQERDQRMKAELKV
jgi:hypothetical protein